MASKITEGTQEALHAKLMRLSELTADVYQRAGQLKSTPTAILDTLATMQTLVDKVCAMVGKNYKPRG